MAEEQKINGFFGQLQGPFKYDTEVMDIINDQCNNTIDYITKIGIHFTGNYRLSLDGNITKNLWVKINNIPFQIGITRMLELEDTKITSIIFIKDPNIENNQDYTNDHVYIDYQYKTQ